MKLFSLKNLVTHEILETDDLYLAGTENPRNLLDTPLKTKEEYSNWCADATTNGVFLSAVEGVNPHDRVKDSNPAKRLHGIIGDYDAETAMDNIDKLSKSTAYMPSYIISTFTPGKVRLIWAFEAPVNVLNEAITEKFLQELNKAVRISAALPGFDKKSFDLNQYFEMGTQWNRVTIEDKIPFLPSTLLETCLLQGAEKAKIQPTDAPLIPIEIVAAEVEQQFPNRIQGAFEIGKKQPLFWINDGIDRLASVVSENGMVIFSDREGTNFKTWRQILGGKFVERFEQEQTGKAAQMFWFDGKTYWTKHHAENFVYLAKEDAKLHLRGAGVNDRPQRGQQVSDVERVLIHVQTQRRVSAAVPILFSPDETVDFGGERYLNISNKRVTQPAASASVDQFPWLHEFIMKSFDGEFEGVPAFEYFLGWFKRFYESALNCRPLPGQVIIIAGEAHTGKSFLNKWVIGEALGGSVDAEPLLMKETSFNKQGAECALWRCDDAATDGNWKTREMFTKSLKQMAANPSQLYQPKFRDSVELPFVGRVVVTCNTDPESLRILPTLDGTIRDKIMLFKLREGFRPHFHSSNYDNEQRVCKELPFFLRWLLDREVPDNIVDPVFKRFGVKSFHHAELVTVAQTTQSEYVFSEILDAWLNAKREEKVKEVEVTATELRTQLAAVLGQGADLSNFKTVSIGKQLSKLMEQQMVRELKGKRLLDGKMKYKFVFGAAPVEQPF